MRTQIGDLHVLRKANHALNLLATIGPAKLGQHYRHVLQYGRWLINGNRSVQLLFTVHAHMRLKAILAMELALTVGAFVLSQRLRLMYSLVTCQILGPDEDLWNGYVYK